MAKKRKVIKRVYESGRETTLLTPRTPLPARKLSKPQVFSGIEDKPPRDFKSPPQSGPSEHKDKEHSKAQTAILESVPRKQLFDGYELPSHYGSSRLVLLTKDPFWIHAYWEVSPQDLEALRARLPWEADTARMVLRMYDVTLVDFTGSNANHYFDIEVGSHTSSWYVNLWSANVSYVGEIGLRTSQGNFFPLMRSNCVHTPRQGYSERTEQIWMKVTDDGVKSSHVVSTFKAPKRVEGATASYTPAKKRTIYINEEDIRRYYSKLSPLLRDVLSVRMDKLYRSYGGKYVFILEGESDEERKRLFSRIPKAYLIKRIVLGASENLVLLGASEQLMQGASEFIHEGFRKRKFFFELATELIVYGRTEPDAELYLGDKKIALRGDGTFSLRFMLPDGKLPLEFKAISFDKEETKQINTYVERTTNYGK